MDSFFFVNFINFFLEKPSVSIIIFTTECKEKRERDLVNNKNDAAKEGLYLETVKKKSSTTNI